MLRRFGTGAVIFVALAAIGCGGEARMTADEVKAHFLAGCVSEADPGLENPGRFCRCTNEKLFRRLTDDEALALLTPEASAALRARFARLTTRAMLDCSER